MIGAYLGQVYGAEAAAEARAAQQALEEATLHARARLFNVAFCWEGYAYRPYDEAELERARALFTAAAEAFERLAARASGEAGRRRARTLGGRCRAAIVHLGAVQALARALETTARKDASVEERARAAEHLLRAESEGREYLRLYARDVLDRGDQGLLVSYHYSLVERARALREGLRERAAAGGRR
jgi:hypothetical protein